LITLSFVLLLTLRRSFGITKTITTSIALIQAETARLQLNPVAIRQSISAATDGRKIVAVYFNFQFQYESPFRQGQADGTGYHYRLEIRPVAHHTCGRLVVRDGRAHGSFAIT
jgi:hypothetical protein